MGIKESALALADELEAFEDGDCEECIAYGQPECKGHLSCAEIIARYFARKVRESVERDAEDVTTVSAYDLLPDEDREALAWVRDHGGLESVKKLLDWVVGHCSTKQQLDFDFWLSGRVMHELGFEEDIADRDEVERRLLARLMPEGMEWPTDAIGVRIMPKETVWANGNDGGDGRAWYVESVSPGMSYSIHASDGAGNHRDLKPRWLTHEPPALKVLDADGVEIRKGDTVWHAEDGREGTVKQIVRAHDAQWNDAACVCVAFNGSSRDDYILPANLTHRAPVLAADGKPLEAGQTVYHTDTGREYQIHSINDDGKGAFVYNNSLGQDAAGLHLCPVGNLTHQRSVLDADGVEVHKGDEVWSTTGEFDGKRTVSSVHIDPDEPPYATFEERQKPYSCLCCYLIHRAPVLAADGKPLEAGQTVWHVGNGVELTVIGLPNPGEYQSVKLRLDDGAFTGFDPDQLTHQSPVLDADGVLCREGDEVWEVRSHRRREIIGTHYRDYETGEPLILCDGDDAIPIPATCVTHAKPEPPDSRQAVVNEIGDEMAARIDLLVSSGRWSDAD